MTPRLSVFLVLLLVTSASAENRVPGASTDDHMWWVVDIEGTGTEGPSQLLHSAREISGNILGTIAMS